MYTCKWRCYNHRQGSYIVSTVINETKLQDCAWKQFVAFDPSTNKFAPAAAYWTINASDGSVRPSPLAYVVGVLNSVPDASGNGTILTDGVINVSSISIEDNGPGDYYLHNNGTVVKGVPAGLLPVYCGTLTDSGNFILRPSAPEYEGHRHTRYQLTEGFSQSSDVADMSYVYNGDDDATFNNIISAIPLIALSVIKNGVMLNTDAYAVVNNKLYLSTYVSTDVVEICTINPLIATNSEVRAIAPATGNNIISVSKAYGTVYLDTVFPRLATDGELTGNCVTAINKGGIAIAPVVHQLTAGGGIDIVPMVSGNNTIPGSYRIDNSYIAATLIDFQTINANNVLIGGTATDAIITFPAGLYSSFVGIARVPYTVSASGWPIKVFLWVSGPGAAAVDRLSGSVKTQTAATTGSPITQASNISFEAPASSTTEYVYLVTCTQTTLTAPSNALVSVFIEADFPETQIQLLAAGIVLN